MNHDIAVAWNWEHDEAFVADLERACRGLGLTFGSVTPAGVEAALAAAQAGDLRWGVFLDRAWESDPRFRRLNDLVATTGTRILNPVKRSLGMGDKAAVHGLLQERGLQVPRLMDFMPEQYSEATLALATRDWVRPLWLKPACGGGGDGVLALKELPAQFPGGVEWLRERFVLQENAEPMILEGRPAWFRVIHVFGKNYPFWWHPVSHVFAPVTPQETGDYCLRCVAEAVAGVAAVAGLEIFSCEISLTSPGCPLVIDPVNDPVDFRRCSQAPDAIPDTALASIIGTLAAGIAAVLGRHGPALT
ncbi:MAG: hypothetical protein AAB074_13625 [Planctomycetota bacterium]